MRGTPERATVPSTTPGAPARAPLPSALRAGQAGGAAVRALVLAGRRGPADAVAAAAGVSHRPFVPLSGVPMLVRVVRTLRATPGIGAIALSIDDPAGLDALPEIAAALRAGELAVAPSAASPAASVAEAVAALAPGERLLITTGDHPLLTPEMVDGFLAEALARDADLVVGVVTASTVRAAHPGALRTFVPLRGEAYSGANLFLARAPGAARIATFWRQAERFRKAPWRLASVFGLRTLLLFRLRRLDLAAALARASRAMDARIEAVVLPQAEAAIDVDQPADLVLATRILAAREHRA